MRLGIGSLTGGSADRSAPTVTLQGTAENKADTQDVSFFPYARGYYHGSRGYGYRPWLGYYHPFVRPYYNGFYRPYASFRPYYFGSYYPSFAFSYSYSYPSYYYPSYYYPISTSVAVTVPTVTESAPVAPYARVPQSYPQPMVPVNGSEVLPIPRPGDTYRYDGGPMAPVPMPDGTRALPMTPPIPSTNVAAANHVIAPPAKSKITYPAYGEELPTPRTANAGPILVKKPGQK
jgi:hypothetical protein